MIKALSDKFFHRFLDGDLSEIIDFLHGRPQFKLNLCGDHVTIYYKGMPTIEIHEKDEPGVFWLTQFAYMTSAEKFDTNFEKIISSPKFFEKKLYKLNLSNIGFWFQLLTDIASGIDKNIIDVPAFMFDDYQEHLDILHNIVMENNAAFNSTDYFIIDIEYNKTNDKSNKPTIVALHWEHNIKNNKHLYPEIAFIEIKVGADSMEPIKKISLNDKVFDDIDKAIYQMCKLYLISVPGIKNVAAIKPIKVKRDKIQMIIAPVNCNLNYPVYLKKITKLSKTGCIDFRIATASCIGYGLYDKNMMTPDKFNTIFDQPTQRE